MCQWSAVDRAPAEWLKEANSPLGVNRHPGGRALILFKPEATHSRPGRSPSDRQRRSKTGRLDEEEEKFFPEL